jgi:hypothetical protein
MIPCLCTISASLVRFARELSYSAVGRSYRYIRSFVYSWPDKDLASFARPDARRLGLVHMTQTRYTLV